MQSRDVRRAFLEFFATRGHQVVPSSPLILPSDPTLLFANAGMNQFKEVFLGREHRPYKRAASSQKCLRVSGKHNDLEEVGRTPRHHTFFEMLGNFSFGDYFKRDAIAWAWELITEVYGLPKERLYVTVFKGDEAVAGDEEAARLWNEVAGVASSRIVALGRKDNFWQMGDTGPAGPCTEIHVDMRPNDPLATPETDPGRYLEIWNLVFMQYDLQPDGSVGLLPAPCVDTGAGLERMTAVMGGFSSNYDTDLFQPIIQSLAAGSGVRYGEHTDKDISMRVISDHLRAITMLTAEAVIPGPEKRGSVLRRIMRRALRHGRLLGMPSPFLHNYVAIVVETLGDTFPEIREAQPHIEKVTRREEERFARTLATGFEKLDERIVELLAAGTTVFPGEEAFSLESEQGMPLDLVRDALEERQLVLDETGYARARQKHVETSRVVKGPKQNTADLAVFGAFRDAGTEFVGRRTLRVDATRLLGLIKDGNSVRRLAAGESGDAMLEQTPFYAESGGQQGDGGWLIAAGGRASVSDTHSPLPGVIVHRVVVEQGVLESGELLVAEVDGPRRLGAMRHHTATHLLHAALRRNLGSHVRQAGSLVALDRLRFDFAHYEAIPHELLSEIEAEVNAAIVSDHAVETLELPLEEALATGAMAFFGDRYGDTVRVVRIGEYSLELCGGTHVSRTGELGSVIALSERGVAAGVRRIEAVAGPEASTRARQDIDALTRVAERLGSARGEVAEEVERRLEAFRRLQRENEELRMKLAQSESSGALSGVAIDGIQVLTQRSDGLARNQRRDLADTLRQKHPDAVVVLGAEDDEKAALVIAIGEQVKARIDARQLAKKLGSIVGGGGGGRADMVEAGGKNPERIDEALGAVASAVRELLSGL